MPKVIHIPTNQAVKVLSPVDTSRTSFLVERKGKQFIAPVTDLAKIRPRHLTDHITRKGNGRFHGIYF